MSGKGNKSYKLIYFNSRGAAEVARLLFAVKGVEYEDKRVSSEDWAKMKDGMPQKALPVLQIDGGEYLGQSGAINRYLARELDLYGNNTNFEAAKIDEITETTGDIVDKIRPILGMDDKDKKKKALDDFVENQHPRYQDFLCKSLSANKSGFFVGDKITLADIAVYRIYDFLKDMGLLDKFDGRIKSHYDKIAAVPQIAQWVKQRPVTNM